MTKPETILDVTGTDIITIVLAAPIGLLAARIAATRTAAQPIELADTEERALLSHVIATPATLTLCAPLHGKHFADPRLGRLWDELRGSCGVKISERASETRARERGSRIPLDLATRTSDQALVAELSESPEIDETRAIAHAEKVFACGEDRLMFASQGAGRIVAGPAQGPSLVRVRVAPTFRRYLASCLLALVGAGGIIHAGVAGGQVIALLALLLGSVIWALVDFDTLYIDYPTFFSLAPAAWATAVIAALAEGRPGRLLVGVGCALGCAAFFELSNLLFRLLRGMSGMGGGDSLLVLATVGVPAAVTGELWIGYASVIGSLLAAICGWAALAVVRRAGKQTPFALGPYLAIGWIVALYASNWSIL